MFRSLSFRRRCTIRHALLRIADHVGTFARMAIRLELHYLVAGLRYTPRALFVWTYMVRPLQSVEAAVTVAAWRWTRFPA
jgi:hypothetical protein